MVSTPKMQSIPNIELFIPSYEQFIPDLFSLHSPHFCHGKRSHRSIFEINSMAKGDVSGDGPSPARFISGAGAGVRSEGLSRRGFLRAAALSVTGGFTGLDRLLSMPTADAFPGGKLIGL